MNKEESLIEKTGYSYSGIIDIIQEDDSNATKLLHEISDEFTKSCIELEKANEAVVRATNNKGMIGGMFHLMRKALKVPSDKEMIWTNKNGGVVRVKFIDNSFTHEVINPTILNEDSTNSQPH